jgi:hypothetical protein
MISQSKRIGGTSRLRAFAFATLVVIASVIATGMSGQLMFSLLNTKVRLDHIRQLSKGLRLW